MTILALAIASIAITSAAPVYPQTGTPTLLTIDELKAAANGTCPPQTTGEIISCEDALPYINDAINKYAPLLLFGIVPWLSRSYSPILLTL
jgi:hypothetical protein